MDLADPLRLEPSGRPDWRQAHRLWATDGRISIFAQVEVRQHQAGLVAVVGGLQSEPLVIVDYDLPIPDQRWEFRASGIWVEYVCETPLSHWSYGLEAFALGLDDRRELLGRGYGRRTPLGWELEFHATAEPDSATNRIANTTDTASDGQADGGYHQAGWVEGIVLDQSGEHLVGPMIASRWHWWGVEAEPTGTSSEQPDAVAIPTPDGLLWVVP